MTIGRYQQSDIQATLAASDELHENLFEVIDAWRTKHAALPGHWGVLLSMGTSIQQSAALLAYEDPRRPPDVLQGIRVEHQRMLDEVTAHLKKQGVGL